MVRGGVAGVWGGEAMTMPLVALCADEESLRNPEIIGLAGENLPSQRWLRLLSSAQEARLFLAQDRRVDEVWVASTGDVAPINLAATLKQDRPDRTVCMLSPQDSGSLRSRASAAGIDASLSRQAFAERYALRKQQAWAMEMGCGASAAGTSAGGGAGAVSGAEVRGAPQPQVACGAPMRPGEGAAGLGRPSPGGAFGAAGGSPFASSGRPTEGRGVGAGVPVAAELGSVGRPMEATGGYAAGALSRRAPEPAVGAPSAVSLALEGRRATAAPSGAAGFLLPVVSGSGGAGKSTVSVLLALLAQGLGYDTLLLDFDLQFGDAPELLGVASPLRMDEAIAAPARLAQLRPEAGRPALLATPARLERAEAVVGEAGPLIDDVRSRFDVVVANTGGAWAEQHALLLERSSRALFLIDQRASSLRACRHAIELCARCGIATTPFLYAVNRCGKGAPLSSIDVSCALRGARVEELADGGPDVEELVGGGVPWELVEARNELCLDLEQVLLDVLPSAGAAAERSSMREGRGSGRGILKGRRPRKRKR